MTRPGQFVAMISATAHDLPVHRKKVEEACLGKGVFPLWMEHLPAQDADGVKVSLEMVDQADIYIGVYAWRYGWVPDFDNPERISITEMEFNRAVQRKAEGKLKKILIFIVDDKHPPAHWTDVEADQEAQRKLRLFKDRASESRVRLTFLNADDLCGKVTQALSKFREDNDRPPVHSSPNPHSVSIPHPPAFHAKPNYIPRYKFIGRSEQLDVLSNWAADPKDPVLLVHAIGGNGKSALTWEWTEKYALAARAALYPWAGRFWYSFYESGATLTDFCRQALAYMIPAYTPAELDKKPFAELKQELLGQLHIRPWLVVLDGMERLLVHYHQLDPSEEPDEAADHPTDKIVKRDPCAAIRDEDNDLLRELAGAGQSKILVSSRLLPRVLLNDAGRGVAGVRLLKLPGLNEADAEAFLRSCGDEDCEIQGDSPAIRRFLRENCDNHPLTIGALGGLIVGYRRAPGDYEKWLADPHAGGGLDLGSLSLEQRQNHILKAALDSLSENSRRLLSTLALIVGNVDYETIEALSPHRPPLPEGEPEKPVPPEMRPEWKYYSVAHQAGIKASFPRELADWERRPAIRDWQTQCRTAETALETTLTDLTRHRGLLQYDGRLRLYELHPVVRSVVTRNMVAEDQARAGERILDHFTALPHNPYRQARTLRDLEGGLHVVRTLIKLGRHEQAARAYLGDLGGALLFNVEALDETLSLLRPFFLGGWGTLPQGMDLDLAGYLASCAAIALDNTEQQEAALAVHGVVIQWVIQSKRWKDLATQLRNVSLNCAGRNRLGQMRRVGTLALDLATVCRDEEDLFMSRLRMFAFQRLIGVWGEAEETWAALDSMGRDWSWEVYRPGDAEWDFAYAAFQQGRLEEAHLAVAENLATKHQNRSTIRFLHWLRGTWRLERGEWALAAESLRRALEMAHESRIPDDATETALALAKHFLDPRSVPRSEIERLARLRKPKYRYLARIWQSLGELEQARRSAIAAYERAWADGEPYVSRYELTKSVELLSELNVPLPTLPPYDPSRDEPLPWEADVRAAIKKLGDDASEN